MIKLKNMLRAIHAFIVINKLEDLGVVYIDRLAEAAKICEDEDTWILFSNLFDNNNFCNVYLYWKESSLF